MDRKNQDDRTSETQQGGRTASEPENAPDRSINPNDQRERERERERERGAEDEGHFGDGQGQRDTPNEGGR